MRSFIKKTDILRKQFYYGDVAFRRARQFVNNNDSRPANLPDPFSKVY